MTIRRIVCSAATATPALAAALLLAAPLTAQDQPLGTPSPPERECTCSWETTAPRLMPTMFRTSRARIGVALGETTTVEGRSGIRLQSVQAGGPAERAGLREGDVIVSLDGADLGSEPSDRLLDLLGDVEPGDTLTVGYSRDGQVRSARVVTDRAASVRVFRPTRAATTYEVHPRMRAARAARVEAVAPTFLRTLRPSMRQEMDLVALNPDLGRYFDADRGVLVTSVGEGSTLGLRAGDVILSVGGRQVQDPAHAHSIIASYRPDESIEFEVIRDGRRAGIEGTRTGR